MQRRSQRQQQAPARSAGWVFQGTCNSCGKWGHRKRECPTAAQGTQRQVASVQPLEEEPLILMIAPEEIEHNEQEIQNFGIHDEMPDFCDYPARGGTLMSCSQSVVIPA